MVKTVFVVMLATVMAASTVFAEDIRLGGGGASINTVFKAVKPNFEQSTGMQVTLFESTPKNGLIDLIQGKLDVAVAAVSLDNMVQGAAKDGVNVDASKLQQIAVAKNKTVVLIHKGNGVKGIPYDVVKGIFTGKITNWKEVPGGSDVEIKVVWGKSTPGQNAQWVKEILDGEAVTKNVIEATNYVSIRDIVAANPAAIGIDPVGLADDSVNVPDAPATYSPVIMVTKGAPSAAVQKLIDYVKGEGRKFVLK